MAGPLVALTHLSVVCCCCGRRQRSTAQPCSSRSLRSIQLESGPVQLKLPVPAELIPTRQDPGVEVRSSNARSTHHTHPHPCSRLRECYESSTCLELAWGVDYPQALLSAVTAPAAALLAQQPRKPPRDSLSLSLPFNPRHDIDGSLIELLDEATTTPLRPPCSETITTTTR